MTDDVKSGTEKKQEESENLISHQEKEKKKNDHTSFFSPSNFRSFFNNNYIKFFNNSGPELNYLGFTLRSTLDETLNTNSTPKTLTMHTLLWNGLDGLQAFGASGQKALEYNHHTKQASLLSSLYFLDGVTLLLFSCPPWNCRDEAGVLSTSGSGWAFAFAMWVDFVNASVEFYNNRMRLNFTWWLKDSVEEAIYLKEQIDEPCDPQDKEKLEDRYKKLLGQIYVRCITNETEHNQNTIDEQLNELCLKNNLSKEKILPR